MTSTDRHKQRRVFAVDQAPGGFLFRHGQGRESRVADAALAKRGLNKKHILTREFIERRNRAEFLEQTA